MGVFDVLKVKNGVAQGISFESLLGTGHYSGHVNSSRLPHGHGVFVNSIGISYDGEWVDGQLCGFGKKYAKGYYDMIDDDDDDAGTSLVYAGDFAEDKFHGKGKKYNFTGRLEYEGDFVEGWKEGKGTEYYDNGRVKYEGKWRRDRYDGKGVYHFNNGDIIEGNWVEGRLCGNAVFKRTDGSSYKRIYDNDKIVKEEILTAKTKIIEVIEYSDGDRYEGDINREGMPHGNGTMFYSNGGKYEGEYDNGNITGHGIFYYVSGDKYDGEWKNGVYDGHGIICYKNGDIFECDFTEGKTNGYGLYIRTDGRITRQVWDNGQKVSETDIEVSGDTNIVMKRTINYSNGNKYDGEVLISGERHGHGTLTLTNGDKYEGEWVRDVKHGHGMELWATGAKFEGDWTDGKKNGEGLLTNRNGTKMRQIWENGKLISQEPIYPEKNKQSSSS